MACGCRSTGCFHLRQAERESDLPQPPLPGGPWPTPWRGSGIAGYRHDRGPGIGCWRWRSGCTCCSPAAGSGWRRDDGVFAALGAPAVVTVVPARNEADVIARSIGSLLAQDYAGPFPRRAGRRWQQRRHAAVAQAMRSGETSRCPFRFELPAGWTGKLGRWSRASGTPMPGRARRLFPADRCRYRPRAGQSRTLVARAEQGAASWSR